MPASASHTSLTAVLPSFQMAWTTIAITTGATPSRIASASCVVPYRSYAQAMASTISIAGTMKQTPASTSPPAPARRRPRWIASSVELGPGIMFDAATRSRNSCWLTQPRRVTTSSCIIAMCAAGPPNAVNPSRVKNPATSRSRARRSLKRPTRRPASARR